MIRVETQAINKIKVTNSENQTFEVEVLDIFTVTGYEDKDYILYSLGEEVDSDNEQAYVSILKQEGENYSLIEIQDANEWETVQNAIQEEIEMEG